MVPNMRRLGIVFAVVLSLLSASSAGAQRASEIYVPKHRIADELMPLAEAVIGSEGEAILDSRNNSLILIGPRDVVDAALDLLRQQDRRVPMVRLRYQSLSLSDLAESGLEIAWQGGVGIGVGRLSVSTADSNATGAFGRLYRTGDRQSSAGELRIQSGREGHVVRGRSVPLEGRDILGRVFAGIATAERGFSARPRVLGDGRIQLEFTNTEATVDDAGRIAFSNATTTLVVEPGETVAIGSLVQASRIEHRNGKSYSTRISNRDREDKQIFLLTLDVEEDDE